MLDAAVDRGGESLHRARQLERVEAHEQMPEDRLDLRAPEMCAQAEVLTEPEGQVWIRAAIDTERERVVEDVLVAVRRPEEERELVAGADGDVALLAVLGRDSREV